MSSGQSSSSLILLLPKLDLRLELENRNEEMEARMTGRLLSLLGALIDSENSQFSLTVLSASSGGDPQG